MAWHGMAWHDSLMLCYAMWIEGAIARACVRLRGVGLHVVVVHFGHVDERAARRIDDAIAEQGARIAAGPGAD